MNPVPILYLTLKSLNDSMKGTFSGSDIAKIEETINNYAIASAVASMASGILPGVAGVAAALTQAGFVWATYVKINKTLGISMSEHTAKFIGSAIITNITTTAGTFLVGFAGATIISFIPILGQVASMTINGILGYTIIYASAIIYLKLITKMIGPDGRLNVAENESTKKAIKDIIKENDINGIIKEGTKRYKEAEAKGEIKKAQESPKCPNCNNGVGVSHKFCPNCGSPLK